MTNSILITILLVATVHLAQATVQLSCKDELGNPVDWYIAYKFPEIDSDIAKFRTGYAYAYITSNSVKNSVRTHPANTSSKAHGFFYYLRKLLSKYLAKSSKTIKDDPIKQENWIASDIVITDPKSIVMQTLGVAYGYGHNNSINSILYNDQPPPDALDSRMNAQKAHSKGVVLMDDESGNGLWLTHSTPHFPPKRGSKLQFFENASKFGQTFMCINFKNAESGKKIVDHLINMQPLVYESIISEQLLDEIPDLKALIEKRRKKKSSQTNLAQVITTRNGQTLNIYSKSNAFGKDMYANWIDNELGSALYVETWRQGAGTPLNSSCPSNEYHVNNVKDLKYDKSTTWSYLHDHSKWAISEDRSAGFVCIGDINRMKSQFKRGGGAVCIKCQDCWSLFSNTILDIEPCPKIGHPNNHE